MSKMFRLRHAQNMEATVDELMPDQGKVKVIVTIFGRATPV